MHLDTTVTTPYTILLPGSRILTYIHYRILGEKSRLMPKDSTKVDSASRSVNKLVFDTRQCLRLPAVRPLFYPRLPRQPLTNGSRWPPRSATSRLDITELGQPNDVLSNAPFHQAVRSTGQPGKKIMHPPPSSIIYIHAYGTNSIDLNARVHLRVRLFICLELNGSLT